MLCPDVGEATVNRMFEKLRVEGKIEAVGNGGEPSSRVLLILYYLKSHR